MVKKDDLGERIKRYENVTRNYLIRRMPVVIRLDGVAFHTFTKGFKKPFDKMLWDTMRETMQLLCKDVQNCVLGYTQSDEITLVLVDYYSLNTETWFGNNIQKMCSVIASKASVYFNEILKAKMIKEMISNNDYDNPRINIMFSYNKMAVFDARCFNIPREDVVNCILWRQNDCFRNCVSSIAQSMFSHKELDGKSTSQRIDMINNKASESDRLSFDEYPLMYKTGSFVTKNDLNFGRFITEYIRDNRDKFEALFTFKSNNEEVN